MMQELIQWLDAQNIDHTIIDNEVVEIPNFGKMFLADLSGVESIFKSKDGDVRFNLMENPQELQDEGIFYVAFPFGNSWYYYDLREEFRFNILKHIGKPKPPKHNIPFVNLGIHTSYELLNATGSLEGYCRKAKWLGHSAIGICDRNTMAATLNLQKECAKAGLKHIFGYSLTMQHYESKIDVKLYALTNEGLHNLLQIQRVLMVDSENATIEYSKLLCYTKGCALVLGTLSAYWIVENSRIVEHLKERFDMLFYQVDANEYKADRIDREQLNALKHYFDNCYDAVNDSFTVEPILITDCYYIDRDESSSRLVVNKIATGAAHRQSEEQYFKSVDEHYNTLRPLFTEKWDFDNLFERMCRHSVEIAERADAAFETGKMFMPEYMMRPDEQERYGDRHTMFLRLLDEELCKKIPEANHKVYRERLDEEVYIIESTDNVDYFLVQWDMVKEAKRRGIATGIGRGSAGGSLVSYLLGITSIDPIKYDLIFSRFLVPERCGLSWKDKLTVLAPDIHIQRGIIKVSKLINEVKAFAVVKHIEYHKLDDTFDEAIFTENTIRGKLGENAIESFKSLYDLVVVDSVGTEKPFAEKLEREDNVVVYTKLPRGFYINTPMGHYNPDWAIAFKEGRVKHIYFVAETKGASKYELKTADLRDVEESKIECARRHFASISGSDVRFEIITSYDKLYDMVTK